MRSVAIAALLTPAVMILAVGVAPVHAFTLASTGTGQHLRWHVGPGEPLHYTIEEKTVADLNMSQVYVRDAVAKSFATWKAVQCDVCHDPDGPACKPVSCNPHSLGLSFEFDGFAPQAPWGPECVNSAGETTPVTKDGCPAAGGPWSKRANGNQVMFLADPGEWIFGVSTIALTLVAANDVSGEISDADILLNAEHKTFCEPPCSDSAFDLQSTITHEAGHFLGLDHSLVDGATMVPQGLGGATFMRDLLGDDEQGVCRAYRMAYDPAGCQKPEEPGFFDCSAGPRRPASPWLGLLPVALALAALGCRRRLVAGPPAR